METNELPRDIRNQIDAEAGKQEEWRLREALDYARTQLKSLTANYAVVKIDSLLTETKPVNFMETTYPLVNCNGSKFCDCAKQAMADGANRDWVDGLESGCKFKVHPVLGEPIGIAPPMEWTEKDQQLAEANATIKQLTEALTELVHLHGCEQEGLQSGKPTPEQWFNAVNKAASVLNPEPPKQ